MNLNLLSQKWKQLSCKAKKPEDGGCNYRKEVLLHAVIKITRSHRKMKFRKDGCAQLKEAEYITINDERRMIKYCTRSDGFRRNEIFACSILYFALCIFFCACSVSK